MTRKIVFLFFSLIGLNTWANGWMGEISFGLMPSEFFAENLPYKLSGSIGIQVQKEVIPDIYIGIDGACLIAVSKDDEFSGKANNYTCPHSDYSNYALDVTGIGLSGLVVVGYRLTYYWYISAGAGLCYYTDHYDQIVESNVTGWKYNHGSVGTKNYSLPDVEAKLAFKMQGVTFSFGYSIVKGFMYGIGILI